MTRKEYGNYKKTRKENVVFTQKAEGYNLNISSLNYDKSTVFKIMIIINREKQMSAVTSYLKKIDLKISSK